MTRLMLLAAATLLAPNVACAQSADPAGPPALCTDRPSKATSACTVPRGMFQVEADLVNWTHDNHDGTRTDTLLYASPLLKYGVTGSTDIEAAITPYETVRTRDTLGSSMIRGVGDLTVRVKQRLTKADAKTQFALEPYLKIPTARLGIGNRKVEGGLVGTGVFEFPDGFSLTVSPEIDELENAALDGHHAQLVGAVNVAKSLSKTLTASAELWSARDDDPAGRVDQFSADVALAYLARPTLQLDAGANIGLNRATPNVQAYVGISTRF